MTTWTVVDDHHADDAEHFDVSISAAGRARLEIEQCEYRAARDCMQIRIACVAASVLAIAALIIKGIWGV